MDMRRSGNGVLALAHLTDDRPLGDRAAARDADRAELEQRHCVPVRRLDRQGAPASGDGAGEGDRAGRRRADGTPGGRADVDASVLAGRVRVLRQCERPQDRTFGRPGPAGCDGNDDQGCDRSDDRDGEHEPHEYRLRDVEGNCVHASGASQRLFNDSA